MSDDQRVKVWQRRICWPRPDLTCLEGGCSYCNDHPWRNVDTIERAARAGGVIARNRGDGSTGDPLAAFSWGAARGFCNADTRHIDRKARTQ